LTQEVHHRYFVGIDWSGAKGIRHAGLSVAACSKGDGAPYLIDPPSGRKHWGRAECADWIARRAGSHGRTRALVGIDSSFSMPFVDEAAYLDKEFKPETARDLWAAVKRVCSDGQGLFGGAFVDQFSDHYLRPGHRGKKYSRRMRVAENRAAASGAGPCESVFHLIGPSQVGLSGLSTMCMLEELTHNAVIAVWPYDTPAAQPVTLVEIYAAAFAAMGGHRGKIRCLADLNKTLQQLGSGPYAKDGGALNDHACDAIVTAAGLHRIAHQRKYWHPEQLSTTVRRTEGWVFGIL